MHIRCDGPASVMKWDSALCFVHGVHGVWAVFDRFEGLTPLTYRVSIRNAGRKSGHLNPVGLEKTLRG